MEKAAEAVRKNQWRIAAPDLQPRHPFLSCLDLTCCPCAGYARVSSHVNSLTNGVPAVITGEDDIFDKNCLTFLACLPCYGCLLGSLHQSFRNVHNIEGDFLTDCTSACCCPAGTVTRMEMEATFRQEESRLLKGLPSILEESGSNDSSSDRYGSHSPMVYPKSAVDHIKPDHIKSEHAEPAVKTNHSRSKSVSRGNEDHDITVLDTIPETSQEPSVVPPILSSESSTADGKAQKKTKRHSLQDDATVPVVTRSKPWPLLKYLGQRWTMAPSAKKEHDEPPSDLDKSTTPACEEPSRECQDGTEANNPAVMDLKASPRHSLLEDRQYATAAVSKNTGHSLDEDVLAPIDSNSGRLREHLLHEDPPAATKASASGESHDLESDPIHKTEQKSASKHDLGDDSVIKGANGVDTS